MKFARCGIFGPTAVGAGINALRMLARFLSANIILDPVIQVP